MAIPDMPQIYHIVHVDRLASILRDNCLLCHSEMCKRDEGGGSVIGMDAIKTRRLTQCKLSSHPGLFVGNCVPFYFCPRSIMLFVISCKNNSELGYLGGQEPILHLEADLRSTISWANHHQHKWAFTTSNAGSFYFHDYCDESALKLLNWEAIKNRDFRSKEVSEGKQAEFLVEQHFPWKLINRIGVHNPDVSLIVKNILSNFEHKPHVEVIKDWYF